MIRADDCRQRKAAETAAFLRLLKAVENHQTIFALENILFHPIRWAVPFAANRRVGV